MERISTSPRYTIYINDPDLLSLGDSRGADFECFGEFGASGRARTITIGRRVRYIQKLT